LSSESSICPIDWRPSGQLQAGLGALAALAAGSAWLGALPTSARLAVSALALAYGVWLIRRERLRAPCSVQLDAAGDGLALVFAGRIQRLSARQIRVRGPLASLSGRDDRGRPVHLDWYPDTLPAAARRQLRLAAGKTVAETAPGLATMPG
jgi:toxin CptA